MPLTTPAQRRLSILQQHLAGAWGPEEGGLARGDTKAEQAQADSELVATPYEARSGVLSRQDYERLWRRSLQDPAGFWADMAAAFTWQKRWERDHVRCNIDLREGPVSLAFFRGGVTNITHNCLDRHVEAGHGDQPCFLWEGNEIGSERVMTYRDVLAEVSRLANWLKSEGVGKGDAVALYLPMVCELPIAMLACARIGALHTVVFAGFSSESLAQRILDCRARVVITASGGARGKKVIELKKIADAACKLAQKEGLQVARVLCLEHPAVPRRVCPWTPGRDVWYAEQVPGQAASCPVEWLGSEDPLFLLYTSGSTGRPKGVVHTVGGYMVHAGVAARYCFDLQPGDVFWCTADCGWVTGHTFLAYGPLLNRATCVIYEGVPAYPTPARCWQIVEKHKVRQFYTAPTLIRALESEGDEWVTAHDRASLRVLGTVGEAINPRAWRWYHKVVGEGRCDIVDTYWQTESGATLLCNMPGAWPALPGSATLPFFGVDPVLLNDKGEELEGEAEGTLAVRGPWPGAARTLRGDHARFEATYFAPFKGYYFTGDGCRRDRHGYYTITGRTDDILNVSGHRLGTAEVESALCAHSSCAEAAVVGYEHKIKGEGVYAFVTLQGDAKPSPALRKALTGTVREQIGAFAVPDVIHWAPGLPKTRSGKIMRRVLRKIAAKKDDELGDTSTLADPSVVEAIISWRNKE